MRVLLTTIGSRGDVQPLLALALRLRDLGRQVRLCVPPDFRELAGSHDLPFVPLGPELRGITRTRAAGEALPSADDARKLIPATVANQFTTLRDAAADCDAIVACNQIQVAARSVAELLGIRYVFADYSPVILPSPHHTPPPFPGRPAAGPGASNSELWDSDARHRDAIWLAPLNEHRVAAGLPPVTDVRAHVLTGEPLLAADPALAPWPAPSDLAVRQTGAWILPDDRPLPAGVTEFLAAGEPPVYFGFGSMTSPRETSLAMVGAARALGRRAIVLRGWAGFAPVDDAPDCLAVDETNLRVLFGHVAAVVHHGGAGTTTTASLGGAPQVVVPHHYDQNYFAQRVRDLGIGVAHASAQPTADSLAEALESALRPGVVSRAREFAPTIRLDGTDRAAACLP
ncbi:MAG TPA: glycosyltransferase [Actinophytocola sp.]|jgi:vancomycin aglycone glucosyltransferase|nr:glycosyltransferase [Actinophytocola sp.]